MSPKIGLKILYKFFANKYMFLKIRNLYLHIFLVNHYNFSAGRAVLVVKPEKLFTKTIQGKRLFKNSVFSSQL